MDTQEVIDLTGRAAECVLRFRTTAFTPRPQLDVKSFKAAIASQIRKVAKAEGNRFETPLAGVVRYAGIAASHSVQAWNKISDKENHIDSEWFRNCVCDMVSGAVKDIGHKAFQYNDLNATAYLEPDDYDPFDVTTYGTDNRSVSASSPSDVGLAYYGFARTASKQSQHQSRGSPDKNEREDQQLPMHHEMNNGWEAVNRLAASHTSSNSTAEFIEATAPLSRKRSSPENSSGGSSPGLQVTKPRAKRSRPATSPPNAYSSSSTRATGVRDTARTKRRLVAYWTKDEIETMVKGREDGKDWDVIHAVLPRHTKTACQHKYRTVIKQREEQEISVCIRGQEERVSSPGSGSQGDAEEDAVDE
ncbi:hypothetical protein VPNG_10014 [Cytospora leucostoma]|uniref:Myb-like domain-containing protein n=1 Tax=Cytospora leucostoma TaxID=1230097 RepID=A0A423VHK7_9PEZI|nr:hypothetical protein VPNG_10014 [Cytospora leucostoma]